MSDKFNPPKDISKMDFKELREEVQLLRDELARMKRGYEDAIYNLDYDNFSSRVMKDQKGMQTSIEQTADKISLQAEKITDAEKNIAELSVTATEIESSVKALGDADKELSTKITQTAEGVETTVKSVVNDTYIKNALGDEYVTDATFESHFDVYADGIYATVSERYETKGDATDAYGSLEESISRVSVKADGISTEVSQIKNGKIGNHTMFKQTSTDFTFYGTYMNVSAALILTDNDGNNAFSIFHDQSSNTGINGAVYMWGMGDYAYRPVIIGNDTTDSSQGIYLYDDIEENHIATRKWVRENAGSGGTGGYAVFG